MKNSTKSMLIHEAEEARSMAFKAIKERNELRVVVEEQAEEIERLKQQLREMGVDV